MNLMTKHDVGFAAFPLEYLVIGLLLRGSNHGYQLYHDYVEALGPIWMVGRSKFYAMLSDLYDQGLLEAVLEPQEDRPPRKIYHATDKARTLFLEWLHKPVTPIRAVRVELIAKLRFFDLLNQPGAEELIDAQIAACEIVLARWSTTAAEHAEAGGDPFFEVMFDFRERQAKFIVDWLQATRQRISNSPSPLSERTP